MKIKVHRLSCTVKNKFRKEVGRLYGTELGAVIKCLESRTRLPGLEPHSIVYQLGKSFIPSLPQFPQP